MTRSGVIASVLVALVLGGAVAAVAAVWRPAIGAIDPSAQQPFEPDLVKRGRALAAIGNCSNCHTAGAGRDLAGGVAVPTPFGTVFSSNITPDADTGIGRWSEAAFRRAMRNGVDREGRHLYPTFPYDHFTNVSDEDDRALYAYLMTREPVRSAAPENRLSFPFDQRVLIAGWKLLFLRRDTHHPNSSKSAEWNRGAYLVEGLAHCGACHTPRNALGAERAGAPFAGGDVENWQAYAINADSPSPVRWDADALFSYLRNGWHPDHGTARGPMAQVVANLSSVSSDEVRAIATYAASVFGPPAPDRRRQAEMVLAEVEFNAGPGIGDECFRRLDLRGGLRDLSRQRPAGALWRDQSCPEYRDQQFRSAQSCQYRAVRCLAPRGRAQPDHAGFCEQHERRPDRGPAELFAVPVQQPAGMDGR